eukprot:NODE_6663_length_254_cov_30.575610_g6580_i0.p2 GENE.NODE_6663_length_254_cov_30.575610_g6580_i0~~NODE_6663_length_254_cov_30.575610_g6580_i0.p2  ORF type:complete len:59 (+),score=7.17 NODE_6663_length_254_cov_30.575610_g6580_i0:70-246(+)
MISDKDVKDRLSGSATYRVDSGKLQVVKKADPDGAAKKGSATIKVPGEDLLFPPRLPR